MLMPAEAFAGPAIYSIIAYFTRVSHLTQYFLYVCGSTSDFLLGSSIHASSSSVAFQIILDDVRGL